MYHIICMECGKDHIAGRANSKFCSARCRDRYGRKKNSYEQNCCYCNNKFKSYEKRQFCSFKCSINKRKKEKVLKDLMKVLSLKINCKHCGKEFVKLTHDKIYCSKNCSQLSYYEAKKDRKTKRKTCKECGVIFATSDSRLQCCSKLCSNRFNWRNAYLTRRKKVKNNGDFDRDISVGGIIKRDGNKCYLCENEVDESSHYTSDYYPTIEHVIPISKGGTHTWDNVKLAHRLCNMFKHANEIDDETKQLTLF